MSGYLIRKSSLFAAALLIALSSCVTNKDATYLQVPEESMYSGEYSPPPGYIIQPNDNLYIRVSTPDPRVSAFFNVFDDTGGMLQADEASAHLLSYAVELDGTVDIPYAGAVEVAGYTLPEAKAIIFEVLTEYVTEFSVTLKLMNNYVSVLGEINNPGMYPIYKERLNIFQALAMAGDVDDFSDRYLVSIIRQTEGESIVKEFDITDRSIIDSEFYYVMPNDLIYAQPIEGKFFGISEFPFALILSSITTFLLILNYVQ